MKFPEFARNEINSMKASEAFFKGFMRRIFKKNTKKIFIVGFHKTGTSSIGKALQILGFTVCGSLKEAHNYGNIEKKEFKNYILDKAKLNLNKFDSFQDTPWFLMYKELYYMYPNAYFILTTRNTKDWIKSVQKHFEKNRYYFHEIIYGSYDSILCQTAYINIYEEHNKAVKHFFVENKNFISLDVKDFNWTNLCEFLNETKPVWKFPHTNKSINRGSLLNKVKRFIKNRFYK
jgi:hypothetical protein